MTSLPKFAVTLFVSILFSPPLFCQKKEISIQVTNIQAVKGNMMIAIYDSPTTFLGEQVIKGWGAPVTHKEIMTFPIKGLESGVYAISIYHDKNGNGKFDSNLFRIPKEPYGFSNNPKNKIGPPSFEQAEIVIHDKNQIVKIALK